MRENFSIVNKTKGRLPSLPFTLIKEDILGISYSLSLAFIEKNKMRELNKKYRGLNKATNILSFPLSRNNGEILICPNIVKTETKKFDRSFRELLGFLVIHGCLHLKGMQHSSRMEKEEEKYDQKYFGRH